MSDVVWPVFSVESRLRGSGITVTSCDLKFMGLMGRMERVCEFERVSVENFSLGGTL
jgi:hypothetical protein